jgi:pimeloyl-ACP methyl ester carboxylesterase
VRWNEYTGDGHAGVRLHVRRVVEVEPAAKPVLLLHGLGVGGAVWQAFARRLLPHLAAIAPDLRGHGRSDAPPNGYQPIDYAHDIVEMLRPEGPTPLVGHSLGALVALETAALEPQRVPWLVLLDPPLDPANRNPEIGDVNRLRHAAAGELEAYLLERNPGGGALLAQSLATLFRQASDAAFEAMLTRDAFDVPRVTQPTLIVQADTRKGGVLGDAAADRLLAALPNGRLRKIEGAPHALHASHPAEVAAAVLAFGGYPSVAASSSR